MIGSFNDTVNLVSRMNYRKSWNAAHVLSSYYVSRLTKKPEIQGMPVSVSIEPTTSCNLRCPECPSGLRSFSRATGMIQKELFKSAIDQLSPWLSYLVFYFQGEPFLHPSFTEMVKYASSKNIYTATSTNGHFLSRESARKTVESGLDRLIISIDGTTQDTYQSYRVGGNLHKVLEGTQHILQARKEMKSKTPHVIFQFLVVKPNEHQTGDVITLARKMGVDQVVYKTAQIYDYRNGSDLIPDNDHFSRYKKEPDGTFSIKNKLLDHCWKMWHSCVITWDGKVVPCCFDKDARFVMGDLQKKSFAEIWNGETYQNFRGSLLYSRKEIEICKNCTEGTKVWA
jgi:radical SAM protein with 4Fe4S-binding SPASM domain